LSNIAVKWMEENSRLFVCRDSAGNQMMAGSQSNGQVAGQTFQVTKPTDLLLMGLATCAAHEIVAILERQRQQLTHLRVDVDARQQLEPPHAFTGIHLQFYLSGEHLDSSRVSRALDLSVNKYCPVAATLRGVAAITFSFEIEG